MEINLRNYLQDPKYEGRITFVEQFHKHFKKMVDAYAGKQKVFVFIDDLDRCEIPKAAELMTAVNLLIADDPRLIFVLAMDREKVAIGLAIKYEGLFPYLTSVGESELSDLQTKRRIGLEFGQKFLQKFIQLPFRVPEPNPDEYEDFIRAISSKESSAQESNGNSTSKADQVVEPPLIPQPQTEVTGGGSYARQSGQSSTSVETIEVRRKRELQFGGDSETVRAIASMFADTLGRNPRRTIQFINLFRLQAYISNELGLFDTYQSARGKQMPLTLEQLGKFVAISLRWPALLDDFAQDPALLGKLEEFATENEKPGSTPTNLEKKWLKEQELLKLLSYEIEPRSQGGFLLSDFTVSNRTIHRLLHICPQRVQLQPKADNPLVA